MCRSPRFLLSTLAAVSVGIIGLGGATPAAPVPTHLMPKSTPFYYPTTVGTKWVYDRNGQDETLAITGVEEKQGAKIVTIEIVGAAGKTTPWHKLRLTDREWCWTEEVGHPYDPPWCVFKFPLNEERKWEFATSRSDLSNKVTGESVQAAKTERLKLPAGVFEAVKVESAFSLGNGGTIKCTYWYASGVGLVQTSSLVLKEFVPGKD